MVESKSTPVGVETIKANPALAERSRSVALVLSPERQLKRLRAVNEWVRGCARDKGVNWFSYSQQRELPLAASAAETGRRRPRVGMNGGTRMAVQLPSLVCTVAGPRTYFQREALGYALAMVAWHC